MIRIYHNRWLTTAIGFLGGCTALLIFSYFAQTRPTPIAPRGGEAMERFIIDDEHVYLQTDTCWNNNRLGGSGELFSATGCTVCCVSMALACFDIDIEPGVLNAALEERNGFTEKGWLIWRAVTEISGNRVVVDIPTQPDHAILDRALRARRPVLARILLNGSVWHWVLIVGKEGQEYLMKDPLGSGKGVEPISMFRSGIHAIRIMRRAEQPPV